MLPTSLLHVRLWLPALSETRPGGEVAIPESRFPELGSQTEAGWEEACPPQASRGPGECCFASLRVGCGASRHCFLRVLERPPEEMNAGCVLLVALSLQLAVDWGVRSNRAVRGEQRLKDTPSSWAHHVSHAAVFLPLVVSSWRSMFPSRPPGPWLVPSAPVAPAPSNVASALLGLRASFRTLQGALCGVGASFL